jgi:hypothetical protein
MKIHDVQEFEIMEFFIVKEIIHVYDMQKLIATIQTQIMMGKLLEFLEIC